MLKLKKTILYTECDTNLKKKLYTGVLKLKKNYTQVVLKLKKYIYTGCAKIKNNFIYRVCEN